MQLQGIREPTASGRKDSVKIQRDQGTDVAPPALKAASILAAVQAVERIRALGFAAADARTLADHFLDAERRGKRGQGLSRIGWLASLEDLDPSARPERVVAAEGYERWHGRGALGT